METVSTPAAPAEPARDDRFSGPCVPTLNHGGPGVCRICYPNGAPNEQKQPTQQGELQL